MRTFKIMVVVGVAFFLFGIKISANADELSIQDKLNMIQETADKICKDVPLKSNSKSIELTGTQKAEVGGLIKKFVDLHIEGAEKYQKSETQGVLQQELATAIKNSDDCKLTVLKYLGDRLLPLQQTEVNCPNIDSNLAKDNGGDGFSFPPGFEKCADIKNNRSEGNGGKGFNFNSKE